MKKISTLIAAFISILFVATGYAQEPDLSAIVDQNEPEGEEFVTATFKGFRIINAQTNETAKKHNLHFNIAHRFGDIGGNGGGIHTLYGFDNSTDIRFSFDYGISDRLQAGVGRSKGNEPYTELYDGNIKFRLLRQTTDNKMPLSLTLYGIAGISGRRPSTDSTSEASFSNTSDRMSYTTQAIIARKFSQSISLELLPTWSHRNYVSFEDENDIFAIGIGTRIKITKRFAFIADYFYNFSQYRHDAKDSNGDKLYYDPLSVGVEIETGGHVFTINFTNATGIIENIYLPFTRSNWLDGEFRFGFNISRNFVIGGGKW